MSTHSAGVLLALDGILSPSARARIPSSDGNATVTDGPFAEAKESVVGYREIEACSREEAIEWFGRAPIIEVCKTFAMPDDIWDEVQIAARGFAQRKVGA